MAEPTFERERNSPRYKILISGKEMPPEQAVDLLEVSVSDYVEGANTFDLTFNHWHSKNQEFKSIPISIGDEIEVKVGFVDHLETIIVGEVTALEPEFHENEAPTLKFHGYDLLHRFRRGRKTRTFLEMKDSEIAEKIARELKLNVNAEDTGVKHEYLLQNNVTDIDFLLERAHRIDYEVIIKERTLHFRKSANHSSEVLSIEYGYTLQSFYPRLNSLNQVSEVVVQGWDPKNKELIKASASPADEKSKMGGSKLGSAISQSAFFKSQTLIVDKPVLSDGEASQVAKGRFSTMSVDFVMGEGKAIGNTKIRAGEVVELLKLGDQFSGKYYITSSKHIIDRNGYSTRFSAGRNAV